MSRPTLLAGHEPSADEFSFLLPLVGYKTADGSLTNNTTLQNDGDLFVVPAVNGVYAVRLVLFTEGGTIGDLKLAFTWATGATFPWGILAYTTSISGTAGGSMFAGAFGTPTSGTSNFAAGETNAGNVNMVIVEGTLTMASTAGNLQLQWAQSTLDSGTATKVKAGSTIIATRLQ